MSLTLSSNTVYTPSNLVELTNSCVLVLEDGGGSSPDFTFVVSPSIETIKNILDKQFRFLRMGHFSCDVELANTEITCNVVNKDGYILSSIIMKLPDPKERDEIRDMCQKYQIKLS